MNSTSFNINVWIPFISFNLFFMIIGIPSNILILIFYPFKSKTSNSSTFFIKILAIIDLTSCFFQIPQTMFVEMGMVTNFGFCKFTFFFVYFLSGYSISTFTNLSVERWFLIKKPFSFKKIHSHILNGIAIISSVCLATVTLFLSRIGPKIRNDNRLTNNCFLDISDEVGISFTVLLIILFFGSFVIMLICYANIYIYIYKKVKKNKSKIQTISTNKDSLNDKQLSVQQIRSASMIFGVTLLYILSWLPPYLVMLKIINKNIYLLYIFFLNTSTNFFIYVIFNKNFRKIVYNGFRRFKFNHIDSLVLSRS